MEKPILLLTGRNNLGQEEDREILAVHLSRTFSIVISYFDERKWQNPSAYSMILSRCVWTWPTDRENPGKFEKDMREFNSFMKNSPVPVYNPRIGKGDMQGKNYLITLFRLGYPVIPTVDLPNEVESLGPAEAYVVKPKNGMGSEGISIMSKSELLSKNPQNSIIQPLLEFSGEVSFYFVDSQFQYALLFEPTRDAARTTPKEFAPPQPELEFALKFVHWNNLPFGIQRIDALRLMDGRLLLLEIEDSAQHLCLKYAPQEARVRFLAALEKSISKLLFVK